jgi:hypothetical protein
MNRTFTYFHTFHNELAANVKANPLFMRWVFQIRPVVRSSTQTGVGVEVGRDSTSVRTPIRRKHVAVKLYEQDFQDSSVV